MIEYFINNSKLPLSEYHQTSWEDFVFFALKYGMENKSAYHGYYKYIFLIMNIHNVDK
jgi:hypothetical protein